jgi:DNA-binding transcriptional LysR family regulator
MREEMPVSKGVILRPHVNASAMNLRRIRHFVVLAETLNFRRAAERLHMAQPPLSVSIQKLEAALGTKLFTRSPTGVSLTASGEASLAEARRMLFHASQFEQVAGSASAGTGGALHVGFVGSTTFGMLQKLVPQFRTEYPGVELILREATSARIVQMVEDDTLDVGLVRTPLLRSSTTTLVSLERDQFIVALPRGNRLVNKALLALGDLAEEPFIMYTRTEAAGLHSAAMLACQYAGFLPRITQEAVQVQTVLSLVESGLGVALVPSIMQRFVNDKIVYRKLADFPAASEIGLALIFKPEMERAAAQRFRALACREFPLPRD